MSIDAVGVGTLVRVQDMKTGREVEYKIVGATEADPLEGRISNESPWARRSWARKPAVRSPLRCRTACAP